jgi:hypothetical protein
MPEEACIFVAKGRAARSYTADCAGMAGWDDAEVRPPSVLKLESIRSGDS